MSRYLCKVSTNKGCVVISSVGGYPYDCWYKEKYPNAMVYQCTKHGKWWVNENTKERT